MGRKYVECSLFCASLLLAIVMGSKLPRKLTWCLGQSGTSTNNSVLVSILLDHTIAEDFHQSVSILQVLANDRATNDMYIRDDNSR
ncbi:hypothetical protein FIBSPDRAFT_185908 [Athelia psychrophila]|uniref:Uncharacterized protein n=1 Tax=Athelia psychrophila TaxID=1759441 RepID=A0A166AAJ6_9AGAM|nr:hypothetical protein FIBSPDRAFT_185908 [Fibularhizoctonia sp. CBS 109695]